MTEPESKAGSTGGSRDANFWHEQGVKDWQNGKLDDAEDAFRAAANLEPTRGRHFAALREIALLKNSNSAALCAARRVIEIEPSSVEGQDRLARILVLVGDYDGAEMAQRRALALEPQKAELHHFLGHILQLRRQFTGAESAVRRALLEEETATYQIKLAEILAYQGRWRDANLEVRKAVQLLRERLRPTDPL